MINRTNLIFTHKLIIAFADSLVKVFIPLIILKGSGDMMLTMFYLSAYYILTAILNIVLKKFLQKYGIIAMVLHSIPLIALQFVLTLPINFWVCLIVAILSSLGQVLYSVPLNLLFTFTDKDVNVAKFQIATNVGKLIFILLSGYVLGSTLNNSLLLLAIVGTVLYVLSVIPVLYGYRLLKFTYQKISQEKEETNKKGYAWFNVFHMAFAVYQSILDVIIPLYLYLENLTIDKIAIVMALIELSKIFANLLGKFFVKKGKPFISVLVSVAFLVAGTIVMIFVKDAVALYICSCVVAISFPLLFVPMFSAFIKKIKTDKNQFDGMSYRDVYISFGKEFLFVPYFLIPYLIGQFVVGSASAVVVAFSAYKPAKEKK